MTRNDIITKVKALKLPKNSYVVFGSCPMAAAGIRESSDIDMLVSEEVFSRLEKAGWQKVDKGPQDKPLVHDDFDIHRDWSFSPPYNPTLENLLSTATVIDGVPFASLSEVRKWKVASGRPKDIIDIKLIDQYLQGL